VWTAGGRLCTGKNGEEGCRGAICVLKGTAGAKPHHSNPPLPPPQDSTLLRKGGLALLPRDISSALAAPRRPLGELRRVVDVPRPDLTDASGGFFGGGIVWGVGGGVRRRARRVLRV
jgi:hypothetical protein